MIQHSNDATGIHSGPANRSRELELSALAGLEAGVIGAVSMLGFLCSYSALRGLPWWSFVNLLGSVAYGSSTFRRGFGRATVAGLAVEILLCGFAGVVFGLCFARTRGRMASLVLGLSSGLIWFFFSFEVIFRAIGPLIPVYASPAASLLGHMIFGLVLSQTPALYQAWPKGWRLMDARNASLAGSGNPNANHQRETTEIVSQHRLE